MKIQVQAETTGEELLKIFLDDLKANNITPTWKEGNPLPDGVLVQVWSEKGAKLIPFEAKNIRFSYSN
jgi:hypothetical protein